MTTRISLERKFATKTDTIATLLLKHFGGNPYYAMAKTVGGEVTYQPVNQSLTEELIQQHLDGKITIGSYQILQQDNTVRWLGWDVDSNNVDTARKYASQILSKIQDIQHVVEFSGSKGYHILVFLSQPILATKAKQIAEAVRGDLPKAGSSHVECFPKQDVLTKSKPMGSLLKLPLGVHPRTHERSRFVDPSNGWENGQDSDAFVALSDGIDPSTLDVLLADRTDPRKAIVQLMLPYWTEGERHNVALYLTGYLAHLGWGLEDVMSIIQDICKATGDDGEENRTQAVTDTFKSIEEGKTVKGFSGLNDLLPGSVMRNLIDYATQIITPSLVKRLDSIRLSKGATFEKTRAASHVIWADLQEQGEVVQTDFRYAYWYNSSTHTLTPLESIEWQAILHHNYGINPAESFGTQVTKEIKLKAVSNARVVDVRNRTVWDGSKLFVNLGGPEVYVLDGEDIHLEFNGECGYLFQTDIHSSIQIKPDFTSKIDVWDYLVTDISFSRSSEVPAKPEEQSQLLKAWILAFFFQELMPTKPLLLAMGAPGSGKTTAMRRIMKVLDSPDSDVLEVATDKQDSLRTSLVAHRLIVLDNLENSGVRWLVDTLNRLATGSVIELRELYQTNQVHVIRPRCFVAMTAVSMPFSEDTLFSRILPLEMQVLKNPMPEYMLQKRINDHLNGIWADLLLKLNQVVATLRRSNELEPPIASRLADFTVFCKRIEKSGVVSGALLIQGLRSLVDRQKLALLAASPFIEILEDFLSTQPDDAAKFHTMIELYTLLESMARQKKVRWQWTNAMALGRHIMTLKDQLEKLYHATIEPLDGRDVFKIKFAKLAQ